MKPIELLDQCARSREQGLSWITLVMQRKQPPRGERVRVLPGLFGHLLSCTDRGVVVSVKVDDTIRWLTKHMSEIERWAVHAMESGDHEAAMERLEQFCLVRDRLGVLLAYREATP
jgi:hypothetical protein